MTENQYRVFQKSVKGTRNLYNVAKIMDVAATNIEKDPDSDYYESIYIYNDEAYKQLKDTKSLAGIRDIKTDRLVWDFDSKDLYQSLQDSTDLVDRLLTYFKPTNIRTFFSGSKGFHVEVHLSDVLSRQQFEKIVFSLAEGLSTFDERIKDEQRLFRFPLTKNIKSGLFKIPLKLDELSLSVEEIKGLASDTGIDFGLRMDLLDSYGVESLPQELKELMNAKEVVKEDTRTKEGSSLDVPDMSKRPKHLTPAKYALQQGFFEEGERNEACMILASTYKYIGQDADETYSLIRSALRKRANRLGLADGYDKKELWSTIIEPVFSPLWKGGTFSEEDGLLKRTKERYNLKDVEVGETNLISLNSLADRFTDFAQNIDKNTIKTGIDEIDKKVRLTTGMLAVLVAAPSAGKTSISCGILNTQSNNGEQAVFYSMDMGADQVFQRILQKHTGHDDERIFENFKNNRKAEIENYLEILGREYKNIKFCFKTSLSPESIEASLDREIQMTGKCPKLILLDYLECIQTGVTDPTQSKAVAALKLKDIANKYGICVFLLSQPAKISGGPAGELNSYVQIKGSGVVGEQASVVLSLSRPGFDPKNPENDNYATINVLKNRMGKLSSTDLHWDGLTGHIRSLTHEEENDLKALRKAIASEKKEDDTNLY